jgi:hypothetical protein
VLISLDEERKRIAEQVKPIQDRKSIDADVRRRAAWKKLEEDREKADREWRLGHARQVAETGGGPQR